MELKALVCPQCGASLDVKFGDKISFCPHCGNKLQVKYDEEEKKSLTGKPFVTPDGITVGTAVIPEDFKPDAVYYPDWQSELVPGQSYMRAFNQVQNAFMVSSSKELFYDLKSSMLKASHKLIGVKTNNGYRSFINEEDYFKQWAEQLSAMQLSLLAKTNLPSPFGQNQNLAKGQLTSDIQAYISFWGEQFPVVSSDAHSVLYKFFGQLNGHDMIVLAGGDYEKAECGSLLPFGDVFSSVGKTFKGLTDSFIPKSSDGSSSPIGNFGLNDLKQTTSDILSGKEKMTMSEWVHGGIVGKMIRNKKNQQVSNQPIQQPTMNQEIPNVQESAPEPSKSLSFIMFGTYRKYACMFPAEKENEMVPAFLTFVNSIIPDSALAQREISTIQSKMQSLMQEASMRQGMAQQAQMRTIQLQQQTTQMIARNNAQVSAGIMDSWNKRQAAQTRMSNNFSQAIRGVNSYTTPTGGSVEVGVSADHVYQNQYGDVIGVSGNAVDQNIANQLNWTELPKE